MAKHLIKTQSTPHGTFSWEHSGSDLQWAEAGALVKLHWANDAHWGLQEAHYTTAGGTVVAIDVTEPIPSFTMPDEDIVITGTFKRFVTNHWTEGKDPSVGSALVVDKNGSPVPEALEDLAATLINTESMAEEFGKKLDKPENQGEPGQFLQLDENGDPEWTSTTVTVADKAKNIVSWENRSNNVQSAMTVSVRTVAGDESIDSDKGAVLLGISPNTDFTPSKLIASGFNLLRLLSNNGLCKETADELAWFFPVPHLVATNDSIGTASENNGVLFTDSEGTNLTPAVRFQPIADGEPTAYTDGSAASYVTKDGRRHYVTSSIGWLIVPKTEITWATTCAHIGWSRRYDEYVSPTDANDAGTVIDLSALGTMRTVGAGGSFINDFAERTDATHMLLTTRVGRVKPTWVRGELDEETGLYTYTATVSGIVNDGIAEFEGASMPAITVNGTTLSYESEESTAKDAYVKYNLATVTTASKSVATAIANIEDWGVEAVIATSGTAVVMLQYSQGYPDAVAALLASYEKTLQVLVELIANLRADFNGMREYLNKMGKIAALSVDSTDGYTQMGQKVFDICDGAPQEYTLSTGLFRYDVTNSVLYVAKAIAKDNSGWAIV